MILQELRKQPHLSASAINSYIDCSLAYRFSKIDKIPVEQLSADMLLGSAVHKALQVFYEVKKAGDKLPLAELLQAFEVAWVEEAKGRDNVQYKPGKSYLTMLNEGKALLSTYHKELPEDNFKVLATERAFSFNIDNLPIPIIGQIDLVEEDEAGTIIITDFKTTGKSYSASDVDNNFQLTIYNLAAKAIGFRDREILIRFDCLVKTRTPKFEQHYTIRTKEDEKRAIKKILHVWDGISKKVFIPNDTSWKCSFCEYKDACNEWFQS